MFPNIVEYWGPNGMLYFRNVQVFWQPYKEGDSNLTVAIEAPGASADLGLLSERNELQNVKSRFPAPDFTGHYRFGTKRGYIQFGAAVRYLAWDDLIPNDQFDLNGHVWGWGSSLSSNAKVGTGNVLRLQLVYGRGIENYFNDAPVDVGVERNPGSTVTPVEGEALPISVWSRISITHEQQVDDGGGLLDGQREQQRPPGRLVVQRRALCLGEPAVHARQERIGRRRVPVGTAEGRRRLQVERLPPPVFVQVQLQRERHRRMNMFSRVRRPAAFSIALVASAAALGITLSAQSSIQTAVNAAFTKYQNLKEGKHADYIPVLAKVNPNLFGIAVVTSDGHMYTAGDLKTEVSIQSISKVFTMARVIQDSGPDAIEKRIGVDAMGMRFNSIVSVEFAKKALGGPEINPLVNPGAITATSMVQGKTADEVWAKIIGTHNDFAGRQLSVLQDVYKSEADTNQRNQAIGMLMYAYEYIKSNPAQATDLYTRQCAIGVNAKDLAVMAATLAFGGRNPLTGKQAMSTDKGAACSR